MRRVQGQASLSFLGILHMVRSLLSGSGIYPSCWLLVQRWLRFETLILRFEIRILYQKLYPQKSKKHIL